MVDCWPAACLLVLFVAGLFFVLFFWSACEGWVLMTESHWFQQVNNATARVMTNKKVANPYTNGESSPLLRLALCPPLLLPRLILLLLLHLFFSPPAALFSPTPWLSCLSFLLPFCLRLFLVLFLLLSFLLLSLLLFLSPPFCSFLCSTLSHTFFSSPSLFLPSTPISPPLFPSALPASLASPAPPALLPWPGWKLNPVVGAVYGPELYAGKTSTSLSCHTRFFVVVVFFLNQLQPFPI